MSTSPGAPDEEPDAAGAGPGEGPDAVAGRRASADAAYGAGLDEVAELLRGQARAWAAQLRTLHGLETLATRTSFGSAQFAQLEMAGSWLVGQLTATRWQWEAERFHEALPRTLGMLERGELLVHQATVLLHRTRHCTVEIARAVEARVLPEGAELVPADLTRRVDRTVLQLESEQADGAAAEQRHADAVAQRRTFAKATQDGMGLAGAVLTAEQLTAWQAGLDVLERRERVADRDAGVERTAEQRRADLFAALPAMVLAGTAQDRAAWVAAGLPAPGPLTAGPLTNGPFAAGSAPGPLGAGSGALVAVPDGPCSARTAAAGAGAGVGAGGAVPVGLRPWTCGPEQLAAQVVINVHVPVATVLDLSRAPGTLDRYGPISAEHVRLLRPHSWRRVMVDATCGRPLALDDHPTSAAADPQTARQQVLDMLRPEVVTDTDEPQHDPSARLARLVDLRDVHCCGPGCSATHTHRDHLEPYPHGPTSAANLGRLSPRCHRAKHAGWTLVRHPDGSTTWTSPLGRTYDRPSPHAEPPHVDLDTPLPPLRARPRPRAPRVEDGPQLNPEPDQAAAATAGSGATGAGQGEGAGVAPDEAALHDAAADDTDDDDPPPF